MIKFRISNLLCLIIAIAWVYLGTLPWREQVMINQLEAGESTGSTNFLLPYGVDFSRAYIKNELTKDDPVLESLALLTKKNIQQRPLLAYSWLDLAEIEYRLENDSQKIYEYVSKAQEFWPTTSYSLYVIASFWLKIGEVEKAINAFGQYLETRPSQVSTVLGITSLLESDANRVIELLFAENLTDPARQINISKRMLSYAIKQKNSNLASATWNKFSTILLEDEQLVVDYIKFLIQQNLVEQAQVIWKTRYGDQQIAESFLNSGFELEMIQGSFGWKIGNSTEFQWGIDDEIFFQDERSLMLKFSGESNIQFHHVEQLIPVQPGAIYQVSAYWRGQGITTRSTPHIELSAVHSNIQTKARSQTKRGSWGWEKLEALLEIPEDSALLRVRIKRNRTQSLDKNIAGSVWFDDFKIIRLGNERNKFEL